MKPNRIPDSAWTNPLHFIAFGFGSGAMPVAPGTFGTLIAIPFYLLISHLPLPIYLMITMAFTLFSIWLCHTISATIGVHDHPGMNIDEIVGYLFTMIAAPHGWVWVLLGFGLFRLFDIWKPWPISWVDEHVHGGFGIIFDDILAGLYSLAILQLVAWIFIK